ncbi:DUF4838 domain-containing protein [Cerasicoccus arenae]|uniref:Uncharacterized protein n=1 Tax=Cerasicoccus arenae TaxID=424488 RepID=A0A8J3DI16_9BACT|nr:DUF4838 domain-containing protein [Cerasicoccus arenae]MBK1858657.1 DUF4838 domain-containing protein [Cerasicoccus arenae]GHC04759.1 hypothetical protein GCM10007047_21960 [Cerasicoccus arenae]
MILFRAILLCLFALPLALWAKGPRTSPTDNEIVLLWSADTIIGPVYYSAHEQAGSPVRQVAEDFARILGIAAQCDWPVAPEPTDTITAHGIFIGETIRARLDGVYGTVDGRPMTGQTRRELLDSDSWERTEVLAHPHRLVINGTTAEATRSGVYRFLQEDLGCIWVQPGESGEVIPQPKRFALRGGRRTLQPDFYDRKFLLGGGLRVDQADGLWALRNGASAHFDFNHNLYRIFTPGVMADNEEWRAWRFGKRSPLSDIKGSGSQPDLINPEVVTFAADYVTKHAQANADLLTVSLATNDSIRYDDSPPTRDALTPWAYFRGKPNFSNLVFGFTDRVAELTTDDSETNNSPPPPYITQLAYMWAEPPPDFAVNARIMPYLCSDQSQWYDPQYRADDEALITAWSEAGPRMLGAWEYYQGQPFLIPRYFPTIMAESLGWLWDHRGRGVFFSGRPVWGFDGPKYWLAGQLAWGVEQNHRELLKHYFQATYGPAAESMAAFFDACEVAWMTQPGEGMWLKYWDNPDQFALFPPAKCDEMNGLLDEATARANAISESADRARVMSLIAQTQEAWAVTQAGATLYEAWREVPYPSSGVGRPTEELVAFRAAHSNWLESKKDMFPSAANFINQLDHLNPAARWSTGWESVAMEDFGGPIFEGDLLGGGPESIDPTRFVRGWATKASHAENMHVIRIAGPEGRLRVSGADYFVMLRWLEIQPGVQGEFRMEALMRGVISPGSQAEIQLYFMDAKGNFSSPIRRDRLYPGEFAEWVTLAAMTPMPEGMTHVCVQVNVSDQFPDDWIEINGIDLQYRMGSDESMAFSE